MNNLLKGAALFLGGAIVGATAALLLAPKSGEELRKEIAEFAEDAKKRTQEYCEQVKVEVEKQVAKVKGIAAEVKEEVKAEKGA